MKRGIVIGMVTVGAFAVSGIVTAQKHHRPAGPDAFLNYQVDSTSELVAALTSNPALRRRERVLPPRRERPDPLSGAVISPLPARLRPHRERSSRSTTRRCLRPSRLNRNCPRRRSR
jgi:hypothetical protein